MKQYAATLAFKPEDFKRIFNKIQRQGYLMHGAGDLWEPEYSAQDIAKIANALLAEMLANAPLVTTPNESHQGEWHFTTLTPPDWKLQARLVDIKPVEK